MTTTRFHFPQRRRGFSFAEVMFAVVILGIGFIMVAGIFPVALQQTQANSEQAAAAAFARGSSNLVQQLGQYSQTYGNIAGISQPAPVGPTYVLPFDSDSTSLNNTPPTPFLHGSWFNTCGDLIAPGDPRFAIVPLYMRPYAGRYLQLFLVGVQARNTPTYTPAADLKLPDALAATSGTPSVNGNPATLQPKLLQAQIYGGSPGLIRFASGVGSTSWGTLTMYYTQFAASAVATGTYVVVGNDTVAGGSTPNGAFNGKVYRVGTQRLDLQADGSEWELIPGSDLVPQTIDTTTFSSITADVWIVGRGLQTPGTAYTAGSNIYSGPTQDLTLFTTFVSLP